MTNSEIRDEIEKLGIITYNSQICVRESLISESLLTKIIKDN
jgi:hypothetical protein